MDALDEKRLVYSTGRHLRRWPLLIFYRFLDISRVNKFVLHNSFIIILSRSDYMKKLTFELIKPELKQRYEI